jgi:hypothetical protein
MSMDYIVDGIVPWQETRLIATGKLISTIGARATTSHEAVIWTLFG